MTLDSEPMRSTPTSLPYLAAPADDQPSITGAEVRKLLANGAKLTRDEIQHELDAAGLGHVPLGQIAAALDEIAATVDGEERWNLRSTEDAEALAARRADVLAIMAGSECSCCWNAEGICAELPRPVEEMKLDIAALVDAGAVVVDLDGGEEPYQITPETRASILRHGALFVARATLPELTQPIEDRTAFELAATERFEAERKAKLEAQGERDKLAAFLREKGVDPGDILHPAEPVAPGPKRDVFLWTKIVPVDDAVELEIHREAQKLRAELAMSQAGLDAETDRHKLVKTRVTGRIKELEQAIVDKSFARQHEAYRAPLWEHGVTLVIKASDGVTILDREPIAKGSQRIIPGTEAPSPSPKAESVAPAKDAAAEASADAAQTQEQRAAAVREQTAEKWLTAAEELLRAFGATGLEWGKDGADAANSLARKVHGKERGKLPAGFADQARKTLDALLGNGRAVRRGDAIVWAEMASEAAE